MPRGKSKQAADGAEGALTNKMEAMRRALGELGDAKNSEIQEYIKSKFGLDMSTAMISSYKTHIRTKGGGTGRKRGRPAGGGNSRPTAAAAAGIHVEDVRAVKDLADRLGADKLRSLVDVLYR